MGLIKWNESFSVNIAEIDEQHQGMIRMINDLYDGIQRNAEAETLEKTFEGLVDYIRSHFAREEHYFTVYGYPAAAAHVEEHREFIQKMADYWGEYHAGVPSVSVHLMNYLNDWVRHHIMKVDKQYTPFLNEKGLH